MKVKFLVLLTTLFLLITGCGVEHIEGNLEDIMNNLYDGVSEEELPMMLQNTELSEENIENFIGTKDIKWSEAIVSESLVGSIAHSVVLVRMSEDATEKDIEEAKEKIKEKERKMQLKELEKTEVLELDDIKKTGIIPTISYKEFVNEKRTKEKKESFISSFIKRIKKNREKRIKKNEILGKSTISKEERNTLLLTKREEEKKRKLELKEKAREEKLARIKEKELKKEEAKRKLTELKEQKKQEKLQKKQ